MVAERALRNWSLIQSVWCVCICLFILAHSRTETQDLTLVQADFKNHCVVQAGLKFTDIPLLLLLKCWNQRCAPLYLAPTCFIFQNSFTCVGVLSVCLAVHYMCVRCPRRREEDVGFPGAGINPWILGIKLGSSRAATVRSYSLMYFGDIWILGSLAGLELTIPCSYSRSDVPNPPTFPFPGRNSETPTTPIAMGEKPERYF